jgi:hypothetical protein|tara:strand:- start:164 stop:415 length:252 start_codon:yes stop_codon:yes gene_type:complete
MAKKKTETVSEAPAMAAPTATEASSLGVQDLQNCAQIIDIAMSRGAFRANEAAQVGAVYNKIDAFIKSVAETQNQNAEASASQ